MKIRPSGKSKQGMSLVEVVVAVAILAVMCSGILGSVGYGLFSAQIARENQRATQVMLERLESIRLYSWTQVTNTGFIPATFTDVYDPQSTTAPGCTYYGKMSVTNFPGSTSYAANIRQFIVTLQWTNNSRVTHTRTVATLVAKDGEQNYVY
jgi:prepilin-type N-terminal cleavage/methylation domain-containing protein